MERRQGRTREAAKGQWRWLLPQMGVNKKYLSGRNMPCPACGGRDRFRFTDRSQNGDYYCNQCGAGWGISLLMKVNGWTFGRAALEVDRALGNDRVRIVQTTVAPEPKRVTGKFLDILMDESLSFDEAMEKVEARQAGVMTASGEPIKAVKDAALWMRRYHPDQLSRYLAKHPLEVRLWINRERPWGYYPEERKLESVQAMLDAGVGVDWGQEHEQAG